MERTVLTVLAATKTEAIAALEMMLDTIKNGDYPGAVVEKVVVED